MPLPLERLLGLPRAGLCPSPTPLHPAPRLSAALGCDIWLKRDDVGPVALAGNKVRKFDLLLGDALVAGADVLVTSGAVQSNSARTAAAAAVLTGLDCHLLLAGEMPGRPTANLLLDQLLGAQVTFLGEISWVELQTAAERHAREAAAAGRKPVLAPVGCSSPLGALGFALAYLEFVGQCEALGMSAGTIVHASSSLGTHAGLLVGRALAGQRTGIVGIEVGGIHREPVAAADDLARSAAALIGLDLAEPGADIRGGFLGPGYGMSDAATDAAIRRLARTEAVVTDPVYSGKGAAGLSALARGLPGPVVFWHTGGYHALFAQRGSP